MFVQQKSDDLIGETKAIRSTASLDTAEMTTAIDRFRNWAASVGVYIPSPDEERLVQLMEIEVYRNREFI